VCGLDVRPGVTYGPKTSAANAFWGHIWGHIVRCIACAPNGTGHLHPEFDCTPAIVVEWGVYILLPGDVELALARPCIM